MILNLLQSSALVDLATEHSTILVYTCPRWDENNRLICNGVLINGRGDTIPHAKMDNGIATNVSFEPQVLFVRTWAMNLGRSVTHLLTFDQRAGGMWYLCVDTQDQASRHQFGILWLPSVGAVCPVEEPLEPRKSAFEHLLDEDPT